MKIQAFFMEQYFKIVIKTPSDEVAEIIIAELSEINFYAFEQKENLLLSYIKVENFDEKKLKRILPVDSFFTKEIIKKENWNQQWESSIEPVIVHDFAAIRPSFHKSIKICKHELIITPKMSFGTGHHATTFLMIEMMEKIYFQNKTVLDFGTGTGVLAILAEKCGASKVIAIDNDEWSINNASENLEANNCKNIYLQKQDDLSGVEPVDIILANINLNVLSDAAFSLLSLLKPNSILLTSGYLLKDKKKMQNIFEVKSVFTNEIDEREGWLSILFQKK